MWREKELRGGKLLLKFGKKEINSKMRREKEL
jgi:hypothetical protein